MLVCSDLLLERNRDGSEVRVRPEPSDARVDQRHVSVLEASQRNLPASMRQPVSTPRGTELRARDVPPHLLAIGCNL
eukprot:300823-Rhodomonas_salina.1